MHWKLALAIGSCALLGLRHGFDYDHLAAISDITAVQRSGRQGVRLGVLYALGHACTVVALGVLVILLHISLPSRLDAWAERLIGVTLIVLGILVVANLVRHSNSHSHSHQLIQSRWALLINVSRHLVWRARQTFRTGLPEPEPFAWSYNGGSVFGIGVLHGLGAETPTQLMLFLLAASLGGTLLGFLGLLAFAGGLILMNTVMTAALSGLYGSGVHRPWLYRFLSVAGAVYSLAVGCIFLFGASDHLPPLS
jgi:high-affinity nickel permease